MQRVHIKKLKSIFLFSSSLKSVSCLCLDLLRAMYFHYSAVGNLSRCYDLNNNFLNFVIIKFYRLNIVCLEYCLMALGRRRHSLHYLTFTVI